MRRALPFLLGAALVLAAALYSRARLGTETAKTHTAFLFGQLEDAYRASIRSGQAPAADQQEFLKRIPQGTIDWNSCRLQDQVLYDSWNTPVEIRVNPSQMQLRSAGPDRSFDTGDDISRIISN